MRSSTALSRTQCDRISNGLLTDIYLQPDGTIKTGESETPQQAVEADIMGLKKILGLEPRDLDGEHKLLTDIFTNPAGLSKLGSEEVTCGDVRRFIAEEVRDRIIRAVKKNEDTIEISEILASSQLLPAEHN